MNIVAELVLSKLCWLNIQHPYHQSSQHSLSLPHVTPNCLSACLLPLILGQILRKPYLHFCQQLAERLRAQPEVKDSSAMVDLRRFCGGPNGDWNDGEFRVGPNGWLGRCVHWLLCWENFGLVLKIDQMLEHVRINGSWKVHELFKSYNLSFIFHVCVGNLELFFCEVPSKSRSNRTVTIPVLHNYILQLKLPVRDLVVTRAKGRNYWKMLETWTPTTLRSSKPYYACLQ